MTQDPVARFWQRFTASEAATRFRNPALYGSVSIGSTAESADEGAQMILDGRKTATSSLPDGDATRPVVGALSVVLDGAGQPVAVIETIEVALRTLDELDDDFAEEYGEWDLSVEMLRAELRLSYAPALDEDDGQTAQLLCEHFRVVYRE